MNITQKDRLALIPVGIVLTAMLLLIATSFPIRAGDEPRQAAAVAGNLAKDLIGTWVLEKAQTPGNPSGIGTRLRYFTGTHWMITQPDSKSGVVVFHHGGRYTLDGNSMSSTVDFANSNTADFIGKTTKFRITVDGDTYTQQAVDNPFTETWKRVK